MKIITDTGSDILEIEAKAMGVDLVPISANFEDVIFDRNTEENFKAFYEKLRSEEQLPVSSQPSPAAFLEKYEAAEETGEEVLVILISSKLSGTYNGAVLAKEMCGYEKIYIVDSLQASLSLRLLVEYAVKLKEEGKSAEEIAGIIRRSKEPHLSYRCSVHIIIFEKGRTYFSGSCSSGKCNGNQAGAAAPEWRD